MSVDEYLDSISVATIDSDAPQQAPQEWGSSEPSKVADHWVFILVVVTSASSHSTPSCHHSALQTSPCFPITG